MDAEAHTKFSQHAGVGGERELCRHESLGKKPVDWTAYWATLAKGKSTDQWRTKCVSLGIDNDLASRSNNTTLGRLIFLNYVNMEGEEVPLYQNWNEVPATKFMLSATIGLLSQ